MSLEIRGEQIAVGVVLVLEALRVEPVVEKLAAKDVPPDPPHVPVPLRAQHLLTLAKRIQIDDFVGAVLVFFLDAAQEHEGVMVRRLSAKIEAAEGKVRASVGEILHIGRNGPSIRRYQSAIRGKSTVCRKGLLAFGVWSRGPLPTPWR